MSGAAAGSRPATHAWTACSASRSGPTHPATRRSWTSTPRLARPTAPVADVDPGEVLVRFQPSVARTEQLLSHWPLDPGPDQLPIAHRPYPAAPGPARLTVRDSPAGERREVPSDRWSFGADHERI